MDFLKLAADFISYIKHEENLSNNTVLAYQADLTELLDFLSKNGIKDLEQLKYIHIRMFFSELYNKVDKRSIARKTSSLRSFLRYLNMQGYSTSQLLGKLKNPKLPNKLMFALSVDEIDSFLGIINTNTDLGIRNMAIVEMLYGAGLRVSELVSIKLFNINTEEKTVKVLGKGRKERIVPFNDEALNALNKYLSIRNKFLKLDKPTDKLFLNKSGMPLGVRSVQRFVKYLSRKSGLLKTATPHTMRHSYATHLLEAGASIKTVKELLGHTSIAATQRYTHITMEKLSEMYKKSHPKA